MDKILTTAKFSQDADLKELLLNTGDTEIGEACAYDVLFGIGMSLMNPNSLDSAKWRGENLQGKALMKIRGMLKSQ